MMMNAKTFYNLVYYLPLHLDLPPEVLGAALGYIVHFLNICTLYLDLCLPYKMEFFGSRSRIWRDGSEWVSTINEIEDWVNSPLFIPLSLYISLIFVCIFIKSCRKKYELYNNNIDEDFRVGLEMLNWNVVHFCLSQGVAVSVDKHEQTLPNLFAVFRSPHLGR